MYELKPIPAEDPQGDFVTRQEFEQALSRISELLAAKTSTDNPPKNLKEVF